MDLIAINVLMYVATGSSAWLRQWCSGFGGAFYPVYFPGLMPIALTAEKL
jgi:hypothetical protein